eukprot:s3551_g13.t1
MLDVSTSMLANQASNFLATGEVPKRLGNQHPNIVPYQVMPAADGYFTLAVGNDPTFERFISVAIKAAPEANAEKLLEDDRFKTQTARVDNRRLGRGSSDWSYGSWSRTPAMTSRGVRHRKKPVAWWLDELEKASVGCSPIKNLKEVFDDPHVKAREMLIEMPIKGHQKPAKLVASPLKFSATPASYRSAPPQLGEHTEEVLNRAGFRDTELEELKKNGVV